MALQVCDKIPRAYLISFAHKIGPVVGAGVLNYTFDFSRLMLI